MRMSWPPPPPALAPPPALPPPQPHGVVAARLNQRFRDGVAADGLERAGVVLHQFDGMDDPDPTGTPWKPTIRQANRDHSRTTDRISAALVNRAMTPEPPPAEGRWPIYSHSLSGVVLSPRHNALLCSYSFDSGTIDRTCKAAAKSGGSCVPGCTKDGRNQWCEEGANGANHKWPCAWRPTDLRPMLELRERLRVNLRKPEGKTWDDHKFYNELIFSAETYVGALPQSIEAVFFLKGGDCGDVFDGPKCEGYAVQAHRTMRAHFGLSGEEMPLLRLDPYNSMVKVASWRAHGGPQRAHQTASQGLGLPSALVRRGPAPLIPPGGRAFQARGRPSHHFHCV